jgi:AcrR family transcriptional regulator
MAESSAASTERRTSIGAQRNPASQEAILKAAEELLLEGGLGAFSIEAVARRAKAGKPTIYRWWPTKTALLLDVYQRQKAIIRYPDTGDIEIDLLGLLTSLLDFWKSEAGGAVFRSVIAEAQSDGGAARAFEDYAAERRRSSGQMIRRAQARGEVAPDVVPELVAETLSSFAWGRLLTNRLDYDPDDLRAVVRQWVSGIRVR